MSGGGGVVRCFMSPPTHAARPAAPRKDHDMNPNSATLESVAAPATTSETTQPSGCAEMGDLPPPQKEHEWLRRFVGEWDAELEMFGAPDQPPMKTKGSEHARMIGGFWVVSEGRNDAFPYECRLTLGYDVRRQRYVGTWIDSMSGFLWRYEGAVDATGRVLTLNTEGPFPPLPDGAMTAFREVTEFLSEDHRVFTSSRRGADGQWTPCVRINFRRKQG